LHGSFLSQFVGPESGSPLSRAMSNNWLTNGPEHRRSLAYGARWESFAAALAEDAQAPLNLS
jgi:hypothetical protein